MVRRGSGNREFQELMAELQERILEEQRKIYSERVLREAAHPRNVGPLDTANAHARLKGVCGETIEFWLRIEDGRIQEARFSTDGCGPSVACGSMLSAMVRGKTIDDIEDISPDGLLAALGGLPEESTHCTHLAVNAFRMAIDHWRETSQKPTPGVLE